MHQTVTRVYEGLRPDVVRNQERKLRSVGTVNVRFRSSPARHHPTAHDPGCDRRELSQRMRHTCHAGWLEPDGAGAALTSAREWREML